MMTDAGTGRCGWEQVIVVSGMQQGHQFPLGITMSLERRMELLNWASRPSAFVIDDDYDSEYRFQGAPVPAMQSLDRGSTVILVGSVNKLLFPA